MAKKVRYLDWDQGDSNIARQTLHPIWQVIQQRLSDPVIDRPSAIAPSEISQIELWTARERYQANILGNLAGWAATYGLDDYSIERNLPEMTRKMVADAVQPETFYWSKIERARERFSLATSKG